MPCSATSMTRPVATDLPLDTQVARLHEAVVVECTLWPPSCTRSAPGDVVGKPLPESGGATRRGGRICFARSSSAATA